MTLYHRTDSTKGARILRTGFSWGCDSCRKDASPQGVPLSNCPSRCGPGVPVGCQDDFVVPVDVVLSIDVPLEEVRHWVRMTPEDDFREYLILGEDLNKYGPARLHEHPLAGFTEAEIRREAQSLWDSSAMELNGMGQGMLDAIPFLREFGLLKAE